MFFPLLKSTAPRPEDSSLVNQKRNANSCSSHSSSSPVRSQARGIRSTLHFLLKDCEITPWKDASSLSERRGFGLYVLHACPTPCFLKVSTAGCSSCSLAPTIWPMKAMNWNLKCVLINIDPSCHSVMKWLASIREKVQIWWALTFCMLRDTGKCFSSSWFPHISTPWKLSSIFNPSAASCREGICLSHPQGEVPASTCNPACSRQHGKVQRWSTSHHPGWPS